jgi:Pyruvate/2-oxoacid:ferredoxin oxidoreductase delta subunit
MCELCEKYGDGTKWYLNPANYARSEYLQVKEQRPADKAKQRSGRQVVPQGELEALNYVRKTIRVKDEEPEMYEEVHKKASALMQMTAPAQVVTPDEAKQIVDIASPLASMMCSCRYWNRGTEEKSPEEYTCMGLGTGNFRWGRWPEFYRGGVNFVTPEEAKEWIDKMAERGYVQTVMCMGTAPRIGGLCNCDRTTCVLFRWLFDYGIKRLYNGHYVAVFDYDKCIQCGECIKRCQFNAITWDVQWDRPFQDPWRCGGCGNCAYACPSDAITMVEREKMPNRIKEVWFSGTNQDQS